MHTTIIKQRTSATPFHCQWLSAGVSQKWDFYHQCREVGQNHSNQDNPTKLGWLDNMRPSPWFTLIFLLRPKTCNASARMHSEAYSSHFVCLFRGHLFFSWTLDKSKCFYGYYIVFSTFTICRFALFF